MTAPADHSLAEETLQSDMTACGRLGTVRRGKRDAGRKAAAKVVTAYLADDEAEVHNLTEAAVRDDALVAALHLTGLAADAVAELASVRGTDSKQVLRSLTESPLGTASHHRKRQADVHIVWPHPMDEYAWAITEAKGWIEITVRSSEGEKTITFYDPVRLAQEVDAAVTGRGYFAESAVAVIPAVTREAVESAIGLIAERGFTDIA